MRTNTTTNAVIVRFEIDFQNSSIICTVRYIWANRDSPAGLAIQIGSRYHCVNEISCLSEGNIICYGVVGNAFCKDTNTFLASTEAHEVDDDYLPPLSGPERVRLNVTEAPALSIPSPACAPKVTLIFAPGP